MIIPKTMLMEKVITDMKRIILFQNAAMMTL